MKFHLSKRFLITAAGAALVAIAFLQLLERFGNNGPLGTRESIGQVWTCSMHPQVRLPKPGRCPICLMPLVPATKPASTNEGSGSMLELSDHARAMAGVETAPVERRKM